MITNIALISGAILAAGVCLHPRLLKLPAWRATVTPLASIIGSGFLVVGPILSDTLGHPAWIAMTGLCAAGYLYGSAIRHNIRHIEPKIGHFSIFEAVVERASEFMLSLAYFVSVAYYLNLFAAFGLRIFSIEDQYAIRIAATAAIATIGAIGLRGGLGALERLEVGTVGIKLSVITGLLISLGFAFAHAVGDNALVTWTGSKSTEETIRIVLGLIILVQGFETSRYLGEKYDTEMRLRTMRLAQWISTGIYIAFVFMMTNLFKDGLSATGGETEVIDMLRPLGFAAAPLLIVAALASQSSAAIADMNGAGGLLNETSRDKIPVKLGNLCTAAAAVAVTWSANVFEIITDASKAFVAYYALQSLQAARSAFGRRQYVRCALYTAGIFLAIAVILWAKPAAA